MPNQNQNAPQNVDPVDEWEHKKLWNSVRKAILALPSRFESELVISGVLATDLHNFNTSLGSTIEEQVVASLNRLRNIWDSEDRYGLYNFERQPQTFPDVILKAVSPEVDPQILMGIELKGWYVLAKESEPSFRYTVTPAVCAPADLLVVVPWALSKVISGSPRVFQPFVTGARYAAQYRNYWWQNIRATGGDTDIRLSDVTANYPSKSDKIADAPKYDGGNNFGRLARTGLLDVYKDEILSDMLSGIPISAWQKFLKIFTENQTQEEMDCSVDRLSAALATAGAEDVRKELHNALVQMAEALRE